MFHPPIDSIYKNSKQFVIPTTGQPKEPKGWLDCGRIKSGILILVCRYIYRVHTTLGVQQQHPALKRCTWYSRESIFAIRNGPLLQKYSLHRCWCGFVISHNLQHWNGPEWGGVQCEHPIIPLANIVKLNSRHDYSITLNPLLDNRPGGIPGRTDWSSQRAFARGRTELILLASQPTNCTD